MGGFAITQPLKQHFIEHPDVEFGVEELANFFDRNHESIQNAMLRICAEVPGMVIVTKGRKWRYSPGRAARVKVKIAAQRPTEAPSAAEAFGQLGELVGGELLLRKASDGSVWIARPL